MNGDRNSHHLFIAAVLIEYCLEISSSVHHEEEICSSQSVHMDGRHEWRLASQKLSSFCCFCPYWMLKNLEFPTRRTWVEIILVVIYLLLNILIGCWESRVLHEIILLALIGCEQELNIPDNHLLILTLTLTMTPMCVKYNNIPQIPCIAVGRSSSHQSKSTIAIKICFVFTFVAFAHFCLPAIIKIANFLPLYVVLWEKAGQ